MHWAKKLYYLVIVYLLSYTNLKFLYQECSNVNKTYMQNSHNSRSHVLVYDNSSCIPTSHRAGSQDELLEGLLTLAYTLRTVLHNYRRIAQGTLPSLQGTGLGNVHRGIVSSHLLINIPKFLLYRNLLMGWRDESVWWRTLAWYELIFSITICHGWVPKTFQY